MAPLMIIVVLSLWSAVDGFCTAAPPTCSVIADCEYQGKIIPKGSKKTFYGKTCMECTCEDDGSLSCCGIGYNTAIINVEGCKIRRLANCRYTFVKASNERELCRRIGKSTRYYVPRPYSLKQASRKYTM